jgi:hypothetical protein
LYNICFAARPARPPLNPPLILFSVGFVLLAVGCGPVTHVNRSYVCHALKKLTKMVNWQNAIKRAYVLEEISRNYKQEELLYILKTNTHFYFHCFLWRKRKAIILGIFLLIIFELLTVNTYTSNVYLQCVRIFYYRSRVNHSWKSYLLNCLINVV